MNSSKSQIDFYEKLLNEHQLDVKSLNWGSRESQALRFKIFSMIGDLNGQRILDVGCGLGDFKNWLERESIQVDYYGIDFTPKMIEFSKKRFPDSAERFRVGDLESIDPDDKYDYVFASGIFYLQKTNPWEFMKTSIEKMYSMAIKGVAFNSLTNKNPTEEDEFRADPEETLKFCESLSSKVVLKQDYHPNDFSIYMYREGSH